MDFDIAHTIRLTPVASFIFAITLLTSIYALTDESTKEKFSLRPYRLVRMREYWTFITSGLIHAHVPHLVINMITYYYFAFTLEFLFVQHEVYGATDSDGSLPYILGHGKFAVLYLGCLILSDLPTVLRYRNLPHYSSLGASGAISGIVASMVVFYPGVSVFGSIPGVFYLAFYLLYSWYSSRNSNDNINHEAHLWGAISGIGLTFALYPESLPRLIDHLQRSF